MRGKHAILSEQKQIRTLEATVEKLETNLAAERKERKTLQHLGDYIASYAMDDRMGLVALIAGLYLDAPTPRHRGPPRPLRRFQSGGRGRCL